jgi:hypothetical protein
MEHRLAALCVVPSRSVAANDTSIGAVCRQSFDDHILGPLQRDVIRYTWLHERYSCQGTQATQRTAAYFEFPSVVAMLTREVRYGIQLGIRNVTVDPLQPRGARFVFAVGNVLVDYRGYSHTQGEALSSGVRMRFPGAGVTRGYTITGMAPSQQYAITNHGPGCEDGGASVAGADEHGVLRFEGLSKDGCEVSATEKGASLR